MNSRSNALRLHVESALAGRMASPFRQPNLEVPLTVPVGIPILDQVTGGLPRGCLTELYGPAFSGKTSVLQSALAARTANSESCALIDAQDSFDPKCAESAGVALRQLLWIRCRNLEHAFRSVDVLLHGGGFGLVAMDLSDIAPRLVRQVPLNIWFRLRRSVENTSTILLVLSRESNAKTCASLVLRLEQEEAAWSLRERIEPSHVFHTPACLLDGWSVTGEIIRSYTQRNVNNVYSLDQSASRDRMRKNSFQFELRTDYLGYAPGEIDPKSYSQPVTFSKERTKTPG